MIHSPETFISDYNNHYHIVKASTLKYLIENQLDTLPKIFSNTISGKQQEDYQRYLKIDMKFNYLHSIETLFSLFLCISDPDPILNDKRLLVLELTRNRLKELNELCESFRSLDKIDAFFDNKGYDSKLFNNLFYYRADWNRLDINTVSVEDRIESYEAIKLALNTFALERVSPLFNSIKHGMRIFSPLDEIVVTDNMDNELYTIDMKSHLVYYLNIRKPDDVGSNAERIIRTDCQILPLDYERDWQMTELTDMLITQIMLPRGIEVADPTQKEYRAKFYTIEEVQKRMIHKVHGFEQKLTYEIAVNRK